VGVLTRTPWGRYPEYHTSADDLSFISADRLAESLEVYLQVVDVLEGNRVYVNLCPVGEPQLGRRGLYGSLGGAADGRDRELALLWVLNQSDGRHSLLDIAERSGVAFSRLRQAADALLEASLLREV
jgi:aminopeptidase-like protein